MAYTTIQRTCFVAMAAMGLSTMFTAYSQCAQGWLENGGLPATLETGSVNFGAILSSPSHEYLFVGGRFTSMNGVAIPNFAAFDNGVAISPFSLPGWEHISGTVGDIKEFGGRVYFAGSFTVGNVTNVPLISWDGTQLFAFPALSQPARFVSVGSSGGREVIHLVLASGQTDIVRLDGNNWTGLVNPATGFFQNSIEFLDDVPGGRLIANLGDRLNYLSGNSWQLFQGTTLPIGNGVYSVMRAEGHGGEASLFVGGLINSIDGVTVKNIAAYHNGTWSSVGAGVPSQVYTMTRTAASGHSELVIGTRTGFIYPHSTYQPLASIFVLRGGG